MTTGLLAVLDLGQYLPNEAKELFERVELRRFVRYNVLHPALESLGLYVSSRPELDYKGSLVLPSLHREQIIGRVASWVITPR